MLARKRRACSNNSSPKRFRDRGAIDGHKWLVGPGASLVERAQSLLPVPLAGHEDRDGIIHHLMEDLEKLPHTIATADDIREAEARIEGAGLGVGVPLN